MGLCETLRSKAREMDNVTNPIKRGQIGLGLEIFGFETRDFSLSVITATSKAMAVKYFFIYIYTGAERKQN